MQTNKIRKMTITAMLTAISIVLYFIAEFPIIPGIPHLKLDFSDIPALIATIVVGPLGGIAVELLKNLIHLLRTGTFGIGELANFVVGVSLVLPVGIIFNRFKAKQKPVKGIIIASLVGAITIVLGGLIINALVYPLYMKLIGVAIESFQVFCAYLLSTIPMNLIKAVITIVPVLPLLKALEKLKMGKV